MVPPQRRIAGRSERSDRSTVTSGPVFLRNYCRKRGPLFLLILLLLIMHNTIEHASQLGILQPIDKSTTATPKSNSPQNKPQQRYYYDNVLLMGQFNYDTGSQLIIQWAKHWSTIFQHIQVRGPFSNQTMANLSHHGITAYVSQWENDRGFYSPVDNLAQALLSAQKQSTAIDGVLLAHDDLIFNLTMLEERGFPSKDIIFAERENNAQPGIAASGPTLTFYPNCSYRVKHEPQMRIFNCDANFDKEQRWREIPFDPPQWPNRRYCVKNFVSALFSNHNNNRDNDDHHPQSAFTRFGNPRDDFSIAFYAIERADFVYIPTQYTSVFVPRAQWLAQHRTYLECAMPTLLLHLHQERQAPIEQLSMVDDLWTRRVYNKLVNQGKGALLQAFVERSQRESHGIFHPLKLSRAEDPAVWEEVFSYLTTGTLPEGSLESK